MTYIPEKYQVAGGDYVDNNEAIDNSGVNWVTAGAVSPIQDQKSCGSCWAFSATAAMESAHKIKTGHLVKFSEQQLVDCDTSSHGCNGGNKTAAFSYFE